MKTRAFLLFCAVAVTTALALHAEDYDTGTGISGSVYNVAGGIGYREGIPDDATLDWYASTSANARIFRSASLGRFLAVLWTRYDFASGTCSLSLDEAWMEWRPAAFLGFRIGRSALQYGPCLAFNPANQLVNKNSFDARAGKVGLDGVFLELHPAGASVALNAAFLLPDCPAGSVAVLPDLDEAGAHGRIAVFLPGGVLFGSTELGVSGDFRRLGRSRQEGAMPMAGGCWLSADIGGFVLGAEGFLRTRDFAALSIPGADLASLPEPEADAEYGWALSLNRKLGDCFAIAEACYDNVTESVKGFAKLSWASGDASASVSALADTKTLAARTSLEAAWNATDFLVLRGVAAWNRKPEDWSPALAADWSAGIALEFFY